MLRGISTCICRSRIVIAPRFPGSPSPVEFLSIHVKNFSSGGTEQGGNNEALGRIVDHSFTAAHHVPDGRKFQFATVVVKAMKKGDSTLRIWDQACSLIGGNLPTLAVAFISKPTKSALSTIQELACQLSGRGEGGNKQSPSSGCCSEKFAASPASNLEVTSVSETALTLDQPASAPSMSVPPTSGQANLSDDPLASLHTSCPVEDQQSPSIPRVAPNRGHVPFIGCIMEDMGGEFDSTDDSGSIFQENRCGSLVLQIGPQLLGCSDGGYPHPIDGLLAQPVDEKTGVGGFKLESEVRGLSFDGMGMEEQDGDEGTLSDWENLFTEYNEEANKVLEDSKLEQDTDDEEEYPENGPVEQISKEGLLNFLNALVKPTNPCQEQSGGGALRAPERGKVTAGMQYRQVEHKVWSDGEVAVQCKRVASGTTLNSEIEEWLAGSDGRGKRFQHRDDASAKQKELGSEPLSEDVEATITEEPRNGEDTGGPGSDTGKEEMDYKLVLCVGHMPGTKAVAFHSATTGLPHLPDLENAVTENNPHMLLLGAPGFVFPDLIERLATIFPAGCRAGAFLAPLFTSKQSQSTKAADGKKNDRLFFGTQMSASGAVGLAISSKDKAAGVPVGAFAEFARMSLGMPRIRGYIFLDEPVSKHLFLPRNVPLRYASRTKKGSMVSPSSVLEQLTKQLLKESAVPFQSENTAADMCKAPCKESIVLEDSSPSSVDLLSGDLLSSGPLEEDSKSVDKLPLALLDSVLFPGWSMPLYIYEPCYRVMVRQCLEQGKSFGLSSIDSGSWASEASESGEVIGTIVNLKVHSFERDCRSYIIAHGLRRFRVVNDRMWSEPGSFGLTMGQVQYFDDKECKTVEEKQELLELAKSAVSLCCGVMAEARLAPGLMKSVHDPRLASFAIGHVIDVPARVKRRWLKMVDTKTRLLEQITFLETKK